MELFAEALKEVLRLRTRGQEGAESRRIETQKVRKNNGVEHTGILVIQRNERIVPYIYLEGYLREFLEGRPLELIADEIEQVWSEELEKVRRRKLDLTYEAMKDQIVFRLVHYEKNQEYLDGVPFIPMLDLAVTFHVALIRDDSEVGMFRIREEHLRQWGVTLEEITRLAMENTPRLFPEVIRSMDEILGRRNDGIPMYVLTNSTEINGASTILYPTVLSDLAGQLGTDLYLLPSSIHEFIAVPYQEEYEVQTLREIVQEVNGTQVLEEEYLSDEVYLYERKRGVIRRI